MNESQERISNLVTEAVLNGCTVAQHIYEYVAEELRLDGRVAELEANYAFLSNSSAIASKLIARGEA